MGESETLKAVVDLFNDLISGTSSAGSWVLNREDPGLLKSLDVLTSEQASKVPSSGGASIAAQVEHLRYGFQFLNTWWNTGEEPTDADFSAAWKRNTVSEEEWIARRKDLAREALAWRESLEELKNSGLGIDGKIASVVHLAYHFGAIRQMNRSLRGPAARGHA